MKGLSGLIEFDGVQKDQLDCVVGELIRWNHRINLTSVEEDEIWEKHIVDSLAVGSWIDRDWQILDMGSGAGFPGLPLAVVRDDLTITSVDSSGKKINFQKHVKRLLKLKNFHPVHSRIEALSEAIGTKVFDGVIARAFTSIDKMIDYAWPCLGRGGVLFAMKGPEGEGELEESRHSCLENGTCEVTVKSYRLPISLAERRLLMIKKIDEH